MEDFTAEGSKYSDVHSGLQGLAGVRCAQEDVEAPDNLAVDGGPEGRSGMNRLQSLIMRTVMASKAEPNLDDLLGQREE